MQKAICSVKKGDVLLAVTQMIKREYRFDIIQTSGKKYTSMDNNRDEVMPMSNKIASEFNYVISMTTKKIHKRECKRKGNDCINARLINVDSTGLTKCKYCMSSK